MKKGFFSVSVVCLLSLISIAAQAQFAKPVIKKVSHAHRKQFTKKFKSIKWTGQGLYGKTVIDSIQTNRLRARLQAAFGSPTQKVGDLIHKKSFNLKEAIEFEYWFTVNDSIPMMVLDIDGPFGHGLTYGGASRYIDLMPQIKRAFSRKLMSVDSLADYQDYFYSPERSQWFNVKYKNGKFTNKKISSPPGMSIH